MIDVCDIQVMKPMLAAHGFHFSKAKGQNFLTQSWVPQNIVLEAGIDGTCGVLEVGPGIGPLTQQLCRPQVVRPDRQAVPAMPLGGNSALRLCGLVLGAVSIPGQRRASRMPARSERLQGHGLSPPGKTKSLRRHVPRLRFMWHRHSGTGTG